MYRIFIVEDDATMAEAIAERLSSWGCEVRQARDFGAVTQEFRDFRPHLVLMDIALPYYNGYHWCTEIRRESSVPVIFISSAADKLNIIMAMNLGADDFISKPLDLDVLTAKVQAALRRSYDFEFRFEPPEIRGAALDVSRCALSFGGESISLTRSETGILELLYGKKGGIATKDELMLRLWGTDAFVSESTLPAIIGRLRKKLEEHGLPGFIGTVRGLGYYIAVD